MTKILFTAGFVLIAVLFAAPVLFGRDKGTVESGMALFSDPALGTSGKACSSCHPGGKGLENAFSRKDLARMVNVCISGPLKGKALQEDSVEMRSLILYLDSLGSKKPAK